MSSLIDGLHESRLAAYRASPGDIEDHYMLEQHVLAGSYGYRQLLELVQNAADAIIEAQEEGGSCPSPGRIEVVLGESALYVANTGAPLSDEGVDALLRSCSSPKRGSQIGRFGLGFKSLLRLGGRTDLIGATNPMRFDPARCRRELREAFGVESAPGLRLGWTIDPSEERSSDPLLEPFGWATTVVRAEVADPTVREHLRDEIRSFPPEFLLFLPVPVTLSLDDGEQGVRELHRESDGPDVLLHNGDSQSRWRVVEQTIAVEDEAAKADATHIHARDEVPVAWAVPLEGAREEAGRFWAFFPTQTATRLPGILNAPWKLNSDRNAVIGGEWNTGLMKAAAGLVARSMPDLAAAEDPGRILDAFPRQLERQDEHAALLVGELWRRIESGRFVPDARGELRHARDLWRHPTDDVKLVKDWSDLPADDAGRHLVHPTCCTRERRSRLDVLAGRLAPEEGEKDDGHWATCEHKEDNKNAEPQHPSLRRIDIPSWFEAVASTEPARALGVLRLVEAWSGTCNRKEWSTNRPKLAIVPTQEGGLVEPGAALVAPPGVEVPGLSAVDPELLANSDGGRLLVNLMQVKELGEDDDEGWDAILETSLQEAVQAKEDKEDPDPLWRAFWNQLHKAPRGVGASFVEARAERILVLRRDGEWVNSDRLLLPGGIVDEEDRRQSNVEVLVDTSVHGDAKVLAALGVTEVPHGSILLQSYDQLESYGDPSLDSWLDTCRKRVLKDTSRKPWSRYLAPLDDMAFPRCWQLLRRLKGDANAKFTRNLLDFVCADEFRRTVRFGHERTPDRYPVLDVPHPLLWFVLEHGRVRIGDRPINLLAVTARRDEPAMELIPSCDNLLKGIGLLGEARLDLERAEADGGDLWQVMTDTFVSPESLRSDELRDLWSGAAGDGWVPERLPGDSSGVPLESIYVTGSSDLAGRGRSLAHTVVVLDDHALELWREKGARSLDELYRPDWQEDVGPAVPLADSFPEIAPVLSDDGRTEAQGLAVRGLRVGIGGTWTDVPCLVRHQTLVTDLVQLGALSRRDRLKAVLGEIGPTGWLKFLPHEALRRIIDDGTEGNRAKVAAAETLPEKLLLAVGSRTEPLREVLGRISKKAFLDDCRPLEVAEVVIALLGTSTLASLADTLREEGLEPPTRWNTSHARAFVESIGFPPEFAVSPETSRRSEETVSGPLHLPPLHDFQEEVFAGLDALFSSGTGRRRAVVSLPTGGGKTRVMVQAAVDLVLRPESRRRSVMWVAQTDELCEQAVQAFRQVWVNRGATATDLRIVRLWGGNPNPSPPSEGAPVVVIATIQTLNNRVDDEALDWLAEPGLVVVDECHHAITKSYTMLLRWLDAQAPRPGEMPTEDEPPIVGLSATPFRGTDEHESLRLSKRFDQRWLPTDQEGLYKRLRAQGVLSTIEAEELPSPAELEAGEIERLNKLGDSWGGIDVENILEMINQRLAGDEDRNAVLLDYLCRSDEKSVLFFANSVEHAGEMAARLHLRGVTAAAVSGKTPTAARRTFLAGFQSGAIRVMCNHSVLTTGFDAPKTDMILIARNVFSPVRYMQMVGRGLRGEKNGGTASCKVVTVMDNLGRFGDKHPYHFCRQYFSAEMPS